LEGFSNHAKQLWPVKMSFWGGPVHFVASLTHIHTGHCCAHTDRWSQKYCSIRLGHSKANKGLKAVVRSGE
jgi:hypothetical protein